MTWPSLNLQHCGEKRQCGSRTATRAIPQLTIIRLTQTTPSGYDTDENASSRIDSPWLQMVSLVSVGIAILPLVIHSAQ